MIGDRWRDMDLGDGAGCRTFHRLSLRRASPGDPGLRCRAISAQAAQIILNGGTSVTTVEKLKVKLFADGADKGGMLEMYRLSLIQGFTTNPTLMRKAGIAIWAFAKRYPGRDSGQADLLEVFSDDFDEMERQAVEYREMGQECLCQDPCFKHAIGSSAYDARETAGRRGMKVNVTALMTLAQVRIVSALIRGGAPATSPFLPAVSPTRADPVPLMAAAVEMLAMFPQPN